MRAKVYPVGSIRASSCRESRRRRRFVCLRAEHLNKVGVVADSAPSINRTAVVRRGVDLRQSYQVISKRMNFDVPLPVGGQSDALGGSMSLCARTHLRASFARVAVAFLLHLIRERYCRHRRGRWVRHEPSPSEVSGRRQPASLRRCTCSQLGSSSPEQRNNALDPLTLRDDVRHRPPSDSSDVAPHLAWVGTERDEA